MLTTTELLHEQRLFKFTLGCTLYWTYGYYGIISCLHNMFLHKSTAKYNQNKSVRTPYTMQYILLKYEHYKSQRRITK